MSAEAAGEQIPLRLHDGVRQVVRHRHDALFVAFASHDQRTAGAVGHDVIAVDASDLATPQTALGCKSDHELFRRRGLLHRRRNVPVRTWPGMRGASSPAARPDSGRRPAGRFCAANGRTTKWCSGTPCVFPVSIAAVQRPARSAPWSRLWDLMA